MAISTENSSDGGTTIVMLVLVTEGLVLEWANGSVGWLVGPGGTMKCW